MAISPSIPIDLKNPDLAFTVQDLEVVFRMLMQADQQLGYIQLTGLPINAIIPRSDESAAQHEPR